MTAQHPNAGDYYLRSWVDHNIDDHDINDRTLKDASAIMQDAIADLGQLLDSYNAETRTMSQLNIGKTRAIAEAAGVLWGEAHAHTVAWTRRADRIDALYAASVSHRRDIVNKMHAARERIVAAGTIGRMLNYTGMPMLECDGNANTWPEAIPFGQVCDIIGILELSDY